VIAGRVESEGLTAYLSGDPGRGHDLITHHDRKASCGVDI
jgi:hypothetical protein